MFDEIYEQLKDFCDCLPEMEDNVFENNVNELIHLISLLTCWTQEPCETFLNSKRTEIIEMGTFEPCSCDDGIIEHMPYYTPIHADTLKVSVITRNGLEDVITELTPEEYSYSEVFDLIRVDISKYAKDGRCGCPIVSKIILEYDAGYELLPECLLQLFCDLLHVIYEKNNCDCSKCQACNNATADVEIEFDEGDNLSPKLSVYLNALVDSGYRKQLGLISLCGRNAQRFIGGIV